MKKETIITLNETSLHNVIKNTIAEVKKNEQKTLIKENWFVDMSLQMGDFVYTHFPTLFQQILSLHEQWGNNEFDFSDPTILKNAKETVGSVVAVPAGAATYFGGSVAIINLLNKYKDNIDKMKLKFFSNIPKVN